MKSAKPCSTGILPARAGLAMVTLKGNSLWNEIKVHIHLLYYSLVCARPIYGEMYSIKSRDIYLILRLALLEKSLRN